MSKKLEFGIIQGRLTDSPAGCLQWFPQNEWREEFRKASEIGINFIELIAEINHNPNNPIWTDQGLNELKQLSQNNNLYLHSLCNDYIIQNHINEDRVIEQNINLLKQCSKIGIKKYIMPFFEKSELHPGNYNEFKSAITTIADEADRFNICVSLETILTGKELLNLLELINHNNIKIVYDTGNRVAFGHDLSGDIELLSDNINHVHIKDKNIKNDNVILGTGLVNFYDVFHSLMKIEYSGSYVFETTRGKYPTKTALYNMQLVNFFVENFN